MTRFARAHAMPAVLFAAIAIVAGAVAAVATTEEETPFGKHDPWMPEWMMREPGGPGPMSPTMTARMLRHAEFLNFGVPEAYEGARSTVTPDKKTIAAGRALYLKNCAACHGPDGLGDGDAGQSLSPSPAVLAYMITRPIAVDRYLLWSISDGGEQFGSEMPAFKDQLTQEEIWEIIAYMRDGFPLDMEIPEEK
jgi:mono/diheme cytochrome c family protein